MEGFAGILQDKEFLEILGEIQLLEQIRPFCCHQLQHLMDVARITYILMLETGHSDQLLHECASKDHSRLKEIVYAAALLHDIGRARAYTTGEEHELISAMLAPPILERYGFTHGEIRVVCRAIKEHRGQQQSPSFLGVLLHRADRHSRLCDACNVRRECYKYPEQTLPVTY